MAERIEPSPYFEERPHAEFQFPSETVPSGNKWIDTVIDIQNLQFYRGMAGAPGYHHKLNERVQHRVEEILDSSCEEDCRMDVESGVRLSSADPYVLSVELSCGVIRGEHEDEVDAKAAKCTEHYAKCQRTLGEWLTATELEIDERQAKIAEAEVKIRTQQHRLRDLT